MLGVYTVTRKRGKKTATYTPSGESITSTPTETTITASVQSLTGDELLELPEGDRTRFPKMIVTESNLETNDVIVFSGNDYELKNVKDNNQPGMTNTFHYKAIMLRITE